METREIVRWLEESEVAEKVFEKISGGKIGLLELKSQTGEEWWLLRYVLKKMMRLGLIRWEEGFVLTERGEEVKEVLSSLRKVKEI